MSVKRLTERQLQVLKTIAQLSDELARPPTVSELGARIGVSRQNTREHVWRLREAGYVHFRVQDRQALTPVLTDKAKALLGKPGYAVLGSIAAGEPIFANENLEGYTDRLDELLALHDGDFLLRIDGDSMIGAGYWPGDYVVVRPTKEILDGEIVVAFLSDEESATLKRWYRQDGEVLLVAENPAYPPIRVPLEHVDVQGVVVGHVGHRRARRALRELLGQQEAAG
jgi:repressor LexA